jgi:hypothetical protein
MFAASKSGSVSEPTDSKFNYVTMLLHGNGTNGAQNNTFVDSSTNNFSITRNGNTTQGTFTPYGSNWSNYFSSNSGLTAPNNSAFKPATNDFTVECWVFQTSSGTEQAIYGDSNAATDGGTFDFNINSTGFLKSDYWTSNTAVTTRTSTLSPTVNQWNHVVLSRTGTTLYLGLNGVLQSFTAPSSYQSPATTYPTVGRLGAYTAGIGFIGYISNFRYVNGTNLYSGSTYTVPTTPLTAITNTSLLTCADNRFMDDSTNAFALTVNGSPSVQRFSPFSPTTAYSTSVIGGSGYLDGSGDYLVTPSSALVSNFSADFTIEGWVYLNATTAYGVLIGGNGSNGWYIEYGSARGFGAYDGSSFLNGSSTAVTNQWVNFAVTRASGTVRFFINGTLTASTSSANFNYTQSIGIGAYSGGSSSINGYLSNIRINNSTALYTASFTPSTAPLTAVTNTQLLCNFTNAGILDNAMMNDLETVGNAQISTSVKKYGTGSISFDGSGDGLAIPANVNLAVGSTDFTIEMWVNAADSGVPVGGSFPRLFTLGTAQGAGCIESYNALGTMYVDISGAGGPISFTASTLLNSTWNHYAITRSGTSLKAFVNGTQVGSTATNSVNINLAATTQSWIGSISASAGNLNGYIDDLRITKGFARYTSNFTAPTTAFPDKG